MGWRVRTGIIALAVVVPTIVAPAGQAASRYADAVRKASPSVYWRLGERSSTVAHDASGNGRAATYVNGPTLGVEGALAGDGDTAVRFDGSNDYTSWMPGKTYAGPYTAEAWIRLREDNRTMTFISTRSETADFGFDLKVGNGQLFADVGDGSSWLLNLGYAFPYRVGRWYHVAVTVGEAHATFYAKGCKIGRADYRGTPMLYSPGRPVVVGAVHPAHPEEWFSGVIDEVAIYPRVLRSAVIERHYAVGSGQPGFAC